MIDVKNLRFSYKKGHETLRGLTFAVDDGEIFGFAQPPLFKVQKGNTIKYAYNDAEMAVLSQEMPGAKVNRSRSSSSWNTSFPI